MIQDSPFLFDAFLFELLERFSGIINELLFPDSDIVSNQFATYTSLQIYKWYF